MVSLVVEAGVRVSPDSSRDRRLIRRAEDWLARVVAEPVVFYIFNLCTFVLI